jgi:hypothetical protein
MKYLGLPLSIKRLRKQDYLPILIEVQNRLAGWQHIALYASVLITQMANKTPRKN